MPQKITEIARADTTADNICIAYTHGNSYQTFSMTRKEAVEIFKNHDASEYELMQLWGAQEGSIFPIDDIMGELTDEDHKANSADAEYHCKLEAGEFDAARESSKR